MLYKGSKTKNISFPLGGIGTGCIGLSGNGELVDFEIFNRPNKNTRNAYTHFAIKAKTKDKSITKVLHTDTNENLSGRHHKGHHCGFGFGPQSGTMAGYPHFRKCTFDGAFPIAHLTFSDDDFPARVKLTAFNPFIPHDEYNSSLPAAFFEWEIENTSEENIDFTLAFSVCNPSPVSRNMALCDASGIFFENAEATPSEIGYYDLTALTDAEDVEVQEYWYRGKWKDAPTIYWKNLSELSRMPKRNYEEAGKSDHGTLAAHVSVASGKKEKVRFVLAWNAPNQYCYWDPYRDENGNDIIWKNYYATQFETSRDTAKYALANFAEFLNKTKKIPCQKAGYFGYISISSLETT